MSVAHPSVSPGLRVRCCDESRDQITPRWAIVQQACGSAGQHPDHQRALPRRLGAGEPRETIQHRGVRPTMIRIYAVSRPAERRRTKPLSAQIMN